MNCLSCGCESENYLCTDCISENTLDLIFSNLMYYNAETCNIETLKEYVEKCENSYEARKCIPDILLLFNKSVSEYYYCRYYKMIRDEKFEEAAINYLNTHAMPDIKMQFVLYDLLDHYLRRDFAKPQKWCEYIKDTDDLCCELYYKAALFFSMVGDYDLADSVINKALSYCNNSTYNKFLIHSRESEIEELSKLSQKVITYRAGKPYWPQNVEHRRTVAAIYDKKGISHPTRIEYLPKKVSESEFMPICESSDKPVAEYCSFWCAEVFSNVAAKDIYQIAAVKIKDGVITNEFQSYIRPQRATAAAKKSAAKEAGISVEVLDSAEDVDQVMKKFFSFVGNDILVSTDALGTQAKLISRAARYSSMKGIPNLFFDLLDYAADISSDFDMQNNSREYLLTHFKINEGKDSLEKAKKNIEIYNHLMELDK